VMKRKMEGGKKLKKKKGGDENSGGKEIEKEREKNLRVVLECNKII
jgi:hypothetical protein